MQEASAKELKDHSGWHWVDTHTDDCQVRGCAPHSTAEEAQRCQWESELATARERASSGSARECAECKATGISKVWTDKAMVLGGYMGAMVFLCDAHRTVDMLRKHTKPSVARWQS